MVDAPYAEPRVVTDIADCYFYHTVDIPGHGVVTGEWDLRANLDAYLGCHDFRGQRVLDVGAASGVISFHAERHDAEVVSYDLSEAQPWDIVPFAGLDRTAIDARHRDHIRRINNGYWLCHRLNASNARVVYGTVYDMPDAIGEVDVAVYGSILLHLRDPFLALQNGARLARRTIIVADICPRGLGARRSRHPVFQPRPARLRPWDTWWNLPPLLVQDYLAILGFPHAALSWHRQLFQGKPRTLYTVVAHRA